MSVNGTAELIINFTHNNGRRRIQRRVQLPSHPTANISGLYAYHGVNNHGNIRIVVPKLLSAVDVSAPMISTPIEEERIIPTAPLASSSPQNAASIPVSSMPLPSHHHHQMIPPIPMQQIDHQLSTMPSNRSASQSTTHHLLQRQRKHPHHSKDDNTNASNNPRKATGKEVPSSKSWITI